jgi:SSS family solute:Na+ symporter
MVFIGIYVSRWVVSASDYLVGGKDISWILQGIGLSAVVVAGTTIATQGSIGYSSGLVAHWWVTGWCIAVLLGAFIFAKFFRKTGAYTQTEWFAAYYQDNNTYMVSSIALAIGCFFSPLANILGGSVIVAGLMDIDVNRAIILMGLAVVVYLYFGGLWAALMTDFVQWIIATLVFIVAVPIFLIIKSGDFSIWSNLPNSYWNIGSTSFLPWFKWSMPSIFGMFWMMFCLTSGGFYWHRACSNRTPEEAKKSWILAAAISLPYAFIMPLSGMYIKASGIVLDIPDKAVGVLLSQMPPFLAALGLVGVLAATMSTAVTGIIAGSTILIRDVFLQFKPTLEMKDLTKISRLFTLAYSLASVIGAIVFNKYNPVLGSVYGIALLAGFVASLIPPMLGSMYWKGSKKEGAFLGVLMGTLSTLYSVFLTSYWKQYNPIFTSFTVSGITFILVNTIVKYTGPWWKPINKVYPYIKEKRNVKAKLELTKTIVLQIIKPYWGLNNWQKFIEKKSRGSLANMLNLKS